MRCWRRRDFFHLPRGRARVGRARRVQQPGFCQQVNDLAGSFGVVLRPALGAVAVMALFGLLDVGGFEAALRACRAANHAACHQTIP